MPSAGAALADWGLDVIKVEGVTSGDPGRALVIGGFTREAARPDADFLLELGNRGKRRVAIDLKSEAGLEFFGRLIATADVFLTDWLLGALRRVRLTVEDIRAFNPSVIIARGTGMGVRGPDRDRGGFDAATYLARGGVAYTLTPFGWATPAVQGPGFGDLQGGATLAGGVCAALFHRERSGEATIVDSSLLAQAMWSIAPSISAADFFDSDGIPGAPRDRRSTRWSIDTRPRTTGGFNLSFCSRTSSGPASANGSACRSWPTTRDSSRSPTSLPTRRWQPNSSRTGRLARTRDTAGDAQ